MLRRLGWALLILSSLAATAKAAEQNVAPCGGSVACTVPLGRYRLALPEMKPQGVLVFFHGYQSTADALMRNDALIAAANRAGLALVLPDGVDESWSFPNSPSAARDDIVFVGEIIDDLDRRFGFGARNTYVAGFSLGASIAYYAICVYGTRMAGAIPIAGTFWNPLPNAENCKGPVPPMVHIHGTNDGTFPLAGRQVGPSHYQGDTRKSLALLRMIAQCGPPHPRKIGNLMCEETGCTAGGPIVLCLHDGGHELVVSWLEAALRYLRR